MSSFTLTISLLFYTYLFPVFQNLIFWFTQISLGKKNVTWGILFEILS